MTKTEISFKMYGRQHVWVFEHNLDSHGIRLVDAFESWTNRTDAYTPRSFCEYVTSKDPVNFKCKHVNSQPKS